MRVIDQRLQATKEERRTLRSTPKFAPGGQSTQMIVGATPSSDAQVLHTATHLYSTHGLRRVYYSAFSPIPHSDPRLPAQKPPLVREHRLYQADWLVRFYGFAATELTTAQQPNLDLSMDPKLNWALRHRQVFPVDVNRAPKDVLLRVPGFGVRSVERILQTRRHHRLTLVDLGKMHIPMKRTRYFVITADHNPALRQLDGAGLRAALQGPPEQLSLFATKEIAPHRRAVTAADPAFASWRRDARAYLARQVPPDQVHWGALSLIQPGLFASSPQAFGAPRAPRRGCPRRLPMQRPTWQRMPTPAAGT